jgi:nitrate/nitrite transporter NarK
MVDFCYGWTLWLFLSWIPSFFFQNYRLNLQASALFSAGVFLAGVVGDTLGGVASDALLRKTGNLVAARRYVIIAGFVGAFVFLLPVVLIHEVNVAAVCLSLAFFFLELIVGPIWSIPMDIAPRYAGSASGMMNFGFGVAGIISPFSFGYLVDRTGGWVFPFVASLVLLPIGAVLALRLRPDQPFLALE